MNAIAVVTLGVKGALFNQIAGAGRIFAVNSSARVLAAKLIGEKNNQIPCRFRTGLPKESACGTAGLDVAATVAATASVKAGAEAEGHGKSSENAGNFFK